LGRKGRAILTWLSISGRTYRVQYKTELTQASWTDRSGDVTAAGAVSTKTDNTLGSASPRFYRVALLP
jgi:hypothetical protein